MEEPLEILLNSNLVVRFIPKDRPDCIKIIKTETEDHPNFYLVGPARPDLTLSCGPFDKINPPNKIYSFNQVEGKSGEAYCMIQTADNEFHEYYLFRRFEQLIYTTYPKKGEPITMENYFQTWKNLNL